MLSFLERSGKDSVGRGQHYSNRVSGRTIHQPTTPSLSQTIWLRWASRQFLTLPIVKTLLPVTSSYSLSSEAVVMRWLRKWKRLWRRPLVWGLLNMEDGDRIDPPKSKIFHIYYYWMCIFLIIEKHKASPIEECVALSKNIFVDTLSVCLLRESVCGVKTQ